MPLDRLTRVLDAHVADLEEAGTAKGAESVVISVKPAEDDCGPRFLLKGEGAQESPAEREARRFSTQGR